MIRIGFDPLLEAEQQHRELIKQVEQYRLVNEVMSGFPPKVRSRARLLALIGKGMASLGASLESRFGNDIDGQVNLQAQSNSGDCYS